MHKLENVNETMLDLKDKLYKGLCDFDLIIGVVLVLWNISNLICACHKILVNPVKSIVESMKLVYELWKIKKA